MYGISVAESQTFLLAKRPSVAMSEEKRLPFAGYILGFCVSNMNDSQALPHGFLSRRFKATFTRVWRAATILSNFIF